jgi:hypothetical protein
MIHAGIIALLSALSGGAPGPTPARRRPLHIAHVLLAPLLALEPSDGGGGGGNRSPLPANFGAVPRFAQRQFVPPSPLAGERSFRLLMEPTLVGPSDLRAPSVDAVIWGDPAALPGPPSPGPGCCGGIGAGGRNGIGPGDGPGVGPGGPGG